MLMVFPKKEVEMFGRVIFFCCNSILFAKRINCKALRSELFSVKALLAQLRNLTELTKQLIAIIISEFCNQEIDKLRLK